MRETLPRILMVLLLGLLVVLAGGWLVWYLSYDLPAAPPGQVTLPNLHSATTIEWHDDGTVTLTAADTADAMAALGYAQMVRRPWSLLLLRQAARGGLTAWYGDSLLEADRLSHLLQFNRGAEAATAALPLRLRRNLEAFVDGLNAGLASERVSQNRALLKRGIQPTPWRLSDPIALERLYAWLMTPAQFPADFPDDRFAIGDRLLRTITRLSGAGYSLAFVLNDSAVTHLFSRQVFGSMTPPPFLAATIRLPDGPSFTGVSLIGTPFFPVGRQGNRSWALLLEGTRHLTRWPISAEAVSYDRYERADGSEVLLPIRQVEGALILGGDTLSGGTWALAWPGLSKGTDWPEWAGLFQGKTPDPALLRGGGFVVEGARVTELDGLAGRTPLQGGILRAAPVWVPYLAERLDTLRASQGAASFDPEWLADARSAWAARVAAPLLARLDSTVAPSTQEQEARAYLQNWTFTYDRASIAATIFEAWLRSLLPVRTDPPGLQVQSIPLDTLQATFSRTIEALTREFGSDESTWRWETSQHRPLSRPGLPVDDAGSEPLRIQGAGHPSTLAWGPVSAGASPPPTDAWEAWSASNTAVLSFRSTHPPDEDFVDRITRDFRRVVVTLPSSAPADRTLLRPRQ